MLVDVILASATSSLIALSLALFLIAYTVKPKNEKTWSSQPLELQELSLNSFVIYICSLLSLLFGSFLTEFASQLKFSYINQIAFILTYITSTILLIIGIVLTIKMLYNLKSDLKFETIDGNYQFYFGCSEYQYKQFLEENPNLPKSMQLAKLKRRISEWSSKDLAILTLNPYEPHEFYVKHFSKVGDNEYILREYIKKDNK
jgi:hypothetical protein